MFRLIPKEEKFYEMFIEAATNIHKAAVHLKLMLEILPLKMCLLIWRQLKKSLKAIK